MEDNKKKRSFNKSFKTYLIILECISVAILVVVLSLGIVYLLTKMQGLLVALCITLPILVLALLASLYLFIYLIYGVVYKNFYHKTLENYSSIGNENKSLSFYEAGNKFDEFEKLNNRIKDINHHLSNITIVSNNNNYDNINLEYINKEKGLIKESSLRKNIREIIHCSYSYRNILMSVTYDIKDNEIDEKTQDNIINQIRKYLHYNGLLIAPREVGFGYYVYFTNIDSFSRLKEELTEMISHTSLLIKTIEGNTIKLANISAVAYPYTHIEDMFTDLRYAIRQNKEMNFYLPNRNKQNENDNVFHDVMVANNITNIISSISGFETLNSDFDSTIKEMSKKLLSTAEYLSIYETGIVLYDNNKEQYRCITSLRPDKESSAFLKEEIEIDDNFVNSLNKYADEDLSYFFSSRQRVNAEIGKELDRYGINSGYFYLIKSNGVINGFIYFVNKKEEPMYLDNYLRESLLVISYMVSHYVKSVMIENEIKSVRLEKEAVFKHTNIRSYTIDKETYEIKNLSETFKDRYPYYQKGDKCYKLFFKRNSPCEDCPLITKNKKMYRVEDGIYETSASYIEKHSRIAELITSFQGKEGISHNRFDIDYLVNSYYSLLLRLGNLYNLNAKGYVLTITIDNMPEIAEKSGNEGLSNIIRRFTKEIIEKNEKVNEIYLITSNTFAIILPEIGRLEVIDKVEKIYEISKLPYYQENSATIDIAYCAFKFPQDFASGNQLMIHIERYLNSRNKKAFPSDVLFLEENNYYRYASRSKYILSIIEEAIANKSFAIKLQPIVRCMDRWIKGAELLIRLKDNYNSTMLNTDELVSIASKNGKLSIISDYLINFIGEMYQRFGYTLFKTHSFTRLSINTDMVYFQDPAFLDKISSLMNKYYFPKDFLAFEIKEEELANDFTRFASIAPLISKNFISIVIDQYTGEFLSIDKLKTIGVKEIKIDRQTIKNIDVDENKYESVKSLIKTAEEFDIKVTLVGIENKAQYNLLRDDKINCYLQGYYFYQPLEMMELIEMLRRNN